LLHPKTRIHLAVRDAERAVAFYRALLGAGPSAHELHSIVFELDSPPLILTIEPDRSPRRGRSPSPRGSGESHESGRRARLSLCVNEPRLVGQVAVALRRAGVRLRLRDQGIEANDPDGNTWDVTYAPLIAEPTVIVAAPAPRADASAAGERPGQNRRPSGQDGGGPCG